MLTWLFARRARTVLRGVGALAQPGVGLGVAAVLGPMLEPFLVTLPPVRPTSPACRERGGGGRKRRRAEEEEERGKEGGG